MYTYIGRVFISSFVKVKPFTFDPFSAQKMNCIFEKVKALGNVFFEKSFCDLVNHQTLLHYCRPWQWRLSAGYRLVKNECCIAFPYKLRYS